MDVPTRNAYVNGVVDPDERSAANGLTNVTRSVGAAFGPLCAGLLFTSYGGSCPWPFVIAGSLKIVYDLLLLWSMQSVKPASERVAGSEDEKKENVGEVEVVTFSALQPQFNTGSCDAEETKDAADGEVVEL
jgi:MFS family permease